MRETQGGVTSWRERGKESILRYCRGQKVDLTFKQNFDSEDWETQQHSRLLGRVKEAMGGKVGTGETKNRTDILNKDTMKPTKLFILDDLVNRMKACN